MFAFSPVLAEIADKEPPPWFFIVCAGVCLLAAWPMTKSKWFALIAVPLACFSATLLLAEVRSPDVGPAIIAELGYSYVVIAYVSALLPFIVIAALFFRRKNPPNQAPEPTPTSVTPPARQEARQP